MADLPRLDSRDQRILAALMEKQVTVPASYPMTLNGLRTACNQSSSRDPVTDYDEAAVEEGAKSLKDRGLVRIVWADRGRRTLKYHQRLTEELDLDEREAAALTVLLLRGPQAPGELRTRTERLHGFVDRHEVEGLLARMAERGLVQELPRQPGQKDQRWRHLLGELDSGAEPSVEPEQSQAVEDPQRRDELVRRAYAVIAATVPAADPVDQPFECWLLDRVVATAGNHPVADVGCGSGRVTAHLHARDARVRGVDLSPEMVERARADFPQLDFEVGDLRRLLRPVDADGWGAIVGWYSLVHLAPSELSDAVAALGRVLRSNGVLALALHSGASSCRLSEWLGGRAGRPPGPSLEPEADPTVVAHDHAAVTRAVEGAGLTDVEWYHRGPIASCGESTQRLYVVARKRERASG